MTDTRTFMYGANVHANGIRQHYLRYGGSGVPVVLLPGITSPAITWGFVAERLGRRFDLYVVDARGRGLSETADHLDYSIEACAADVGEFIKALKLEHYALFGHSFGARVALRAARKYPDGLDRLVIVDPPVSGPNRRPYPADIGWYLESIRLMTKGGDYSVLRSYLPTWSDEQLQLRAEWLHTCNAKAVADSYNDFHRDDMHADLPYIDVPTLLMVAGRGDVIRSDELDEILKLSPRIRALRVENAGHMIPWDDEIGFFAALGDFLGGDPNWH